LNNYEILKQKKEIRKRKKKFTSKFPVPPVNNSALSPAVFAETLAYLKIQMLLLYRLMGAKKKLPNLFLILINRFYNCGSGLEVLLLYFGVNF